jgi:multicomponent Na+:H+ antiporter subunit B
VLMVLTWGLAILIAVSIVAIVFVRDLFSVVMMLSVYTGLLASMFAVMGAGDVAFMEAVVGTSVSIVFMMGLMWWVDPLELSRFRRRRRIIALIPALALGSMLLAAVDALPAFGDPTAPAMTHVSPVYLENAVSDMATPNVVSAVLADYRSFDTLIEAAVVVTAVLACLLILRHRDDPVV